MLRDLSEDHDYGIPFRPRHIKDICKQENVYAGINIDIYVDIYLDIYLDKIVDINVDK